MTFQVLAGYLALYIAFGGGFVFFVGFLFGGIMGAGFGQSIFEWKPLWGILAVAMVAGLIAYLCLK